MSLDAIGHSQRELLRSLLRNKEGQTVEALMAALGVSRNSIRQHLTALEGVGWVRKGPRRASGGRPEQLFVLSEIGHELFPRQYNWFAELLLEAMKSGGGKVGTTERLSEMGRTVGEGLRAQMDAKATTAERVAAVTGKMVELGYDATDARAAQPVIEAQNCVFHQLAMKSPEICAFDLAMLETATGARVEHRACMARGDAKCCFAFGKKIK